MNPLHFCLKIGVPNKSELHNWGDYYLAKALGDELVRKGHRYTIQILPQWHTDQDFDADVIIHFRGLSKYQVKPHHFNIMWNISHPDLIDSEEYNSYDLVLVASEMYASEIKNLLKIPVFPFLQFTDSGLFYPDPVEDLKSQLLFVGNSRKVMRRIIEDLLPPPKDLSVYGTNWEKLIPKEYMKASWFPNDKLRTLYSSCDILLNDHWMDMRKHGFLNNRFYDAAVCGTVVLNDDHPELKRLFPSALTYRSKQDLHDIIQNIYGKPDYYSELAETLRQEVLDGHTAVHRVEELLSILANFQIKKNAMRIKTRLPLKKRISEYLLTHLGYGKTYRAIHRGYMVWKRGKGNARSWVGKARNASSRMLHLNSRQTLLNVTTEAEIKALANRLANPFPHNSCSPLVSIIIPSKNGLHHLKKLVPSLLANTIYPNYEVVIVDNGSIDGTERFILEIGDPRFFWENTGGDLNFSQSINYGVHKSRGSLIVLLNNDVMPLYGWLDELLQTHEDEECGVVGARLIYNQLTFGTKGGEVVYPGCSVQHDGIKFRWSCEGIQAYNTGKYRNPLDFSTFSLLEEVPAVTAACLLVDRETFEAVEGFDEEYIFGKEDVDFCLKIKKLGRKIFINRRSLLFHREFSSQIKVRHHTRKNWRVHNKERFDRKWGSWLEQELWKEKIGGQPFFQEQPFHLAFLVTENCPYTTAGDYFSAYGLGSSLERDFSYQVSYLPRRPVLEWDMVPKSTDMIVAMRHDYDIRQSRIGDSTLKIAWIRGYIEEWLNKPWIHHYDGIIASSEIAISEAAKVVGAAKCWGVVPLGITSDFLDHDEAGDVRRDLDVSFVGNIFEVPRDIVQAVDLEAGYNFHFYGVLQAGKNHPWESVHHGPVKHADIPSIYRRSKIVIEDTAPFNVGTVNLRVYEATASGALVICNQTPGIEELFEDTVLVYQDRQDLTEKIRYYLEHEEARKSLAEKAKRLVLERHTFRHRAHEFKKLLIQNLLK